MVGNFQIYRILCSANTAFCGKLKDQKALDMVRISRVLLKDAGNAIDKAFFTEILVCPLSKQPLRFCEKTKSLVSDTIGVSFPIRDGIPCLVPKDGKILEIDSSKA